MLRLRESLRPRADDVAASRRAARLMALDVRLLRLGWRQDDLARKAGFDPDQPRVPAGNPDGGQWTDGGAAHDRWRTVRTRPQVSEFSAARVKGHHQIPKQIYNNRPFAPDTRAVFANQTTGDLLGTHKWSRAHKIYNAAVDEKLTEYLKRNSLDYSTMRPEHAYEFIDEIKNSRDPRIRNFNRGVLKLRDMMRVRPIRGLE